MKYAISISCAIVAGLLLLAPSSRAQDFRDNQDLRDNIKAIVKDYIATHPDEVGEVVKGYLVKHPEAIGEIMAGVLKRRPAQASAGSGASPNTNTSTKPAIDRSTAIATNAEQLFSSPHQITLGNPNGDVTLVEFFDYSCGFCKRALPDMLALIKDDPNLKIALKELPILGPGSAEAARVAVAVRMQDTDGQKYLPFHQELLGGAGPASKEKALTAAKEQGFDMARLEQDAASDEVKATLNEAVKLASAMGINGTPSYVIGDTVVVGAVGIAALKARIEAARGQALNKGADHGG
jgi:protein-disulfide isomerase